MKSLKEITIEWLEKLLKEQTDLEVIKELQEMIEKLKGKIK